MSGHDSPKPSASDETLIERTRSGDQSAFSELWRRHFRSGARVARQFTSSIDADDLVSEAYTRIYQKVLTGGGPTGAFRPYLYTIIRNLACSWGAACRHVQVDDIDDFEDPHTLEDPAAIALDKTLTARAFRSLPERWQSVLWYTEVEGMDPHEVAPLLGMTANAVAALSYRARVGLRKAWLQAHISDAPAAGECQWALSRVGDHARHGLSQRDRERMDFHLSSCTGCAIVSEEVDEVGARLASVMLPIVLGGVAGGALLAFAGAGSSVAVAAAIPAVPAGIGLGAAGAFGVLSAPIALLGTLAVLAGVSASLVTLAPSEASTDTSTQSSPYSSSESSPADSGVTVPDAGPQPAPAADTSLHADDPADISNVIGAVDSLLGSVLDTVTGGQPPEGHTAPGGIVGVDVSLSLSGTGTPGAHLSLQAAGQIYATTTVAADGTFVLTVTAIPGGLSSLELVQQVDRGYLQGLLPGGGLGGLLGTVDQLIDRLIRPLQLSGGGTSGLNIALLS